MAVTQIARDTPGRTYYRKKRGAWQEPPRSSALPQTAPLRCRLPSAPTRRDNTSGGRRGGTGGGDSSVRRGRRTPLRQHFGPVTHRAGQPLPYNRRPRGLTLQRRRLACVCIIDSDPHGVGAGGVERTQARRSHRGQLPPMTWRSTVVTAAVPTRSASSAARSCASPANGPGENPRPGCGTIGQPPPPRCVPTWTQPKGLGRGAQEKLGRPADTHAHHRQPPPQPARCATQEVGSHRGHRQPDHSEAVPGRSASGQDGSAFRCSVAGLLRVLIRLSEKLWFAQPSENQLPISPCNMKKCEFQ
jgi:hypothetical protein